MGILLVYEQIVQYILGLIRRKELKGGDMIMSESQCMVKFDVSRGTVRKAYTHMLERGYVHSVKGKGVFVAEDVLQKLAGRTEGIGDGESRKLIAVIIPNKDSFYLPILDGIEQAIKQFDWRYKIYYNASLDSERKCIRDVLHNPEISGVIIVPVRIKDEGVIDFYKALLKNRIPLTVIGSPPHGMLACSVLVDDDVTVYNMVMELHLRRCKKVATLYESKEGEIVFNDRLRTYYIAMDRFYPMEKPLIFDIDKTDWQTDVEVYLKNSNERTGFLLFNGGSIVPLYSAVERAGKKLKDDVMIIGYGPQSTYEFIDKDLSVMSIPKRELGTSAVELLMDQMIQGKINCFQIKKFPAEFMEGETT